MRSCSYLTSSTPQNGWINLSARVTEAYINLLLYKEVYSVNCWVAEGNLLNWIKKSIKRIPVRTRWIESGDDETMWYINDKILFWLSAWRKERLRNPRYHRTEFQIIRNNQGITNEKYICLLSVQVKDGSWFQFRVIVNNSECENVTAYLLGMLIPNTLTNQSNPYWLFC